MKKYMPYMSLPHIDWFGGGAGPQKVDLLDPKSGFFWMSPPLTPPQKTHFGPISWLRVDLLADLGSCTPWLQACCHRIYRVQAVGLSRSNHTLKITIFFENVKFGAISWKFDILSITASLKLEFKNPLACRLRDTYNCDNLPYTTFRFYLFDFPSQFYGFLP